jgi:hypothetical protein
MNYEIMAYRVEAIFSVSDGIKIAGIFGIWQRHFDLFWQSKFSYLEISLNILVLTVRFCSCSGAILAR